MWVCEVPSGGLSIFADVTGGVVVDTHVTANVVVVTTEEDLPKCPDALLSSATAKVTLLLRKCLIVPSISL